MINPTPLMAVTAAIVLAANPGPTFVETPDTHAWNIVYPPTMNASNYVWTFEVATNLNGPWVTSPAQLVGASELIHLNGATFIRMHGVTNSQSP